MRGAGHDLTPCPKGPASSCDPSPARGLLEDRLGGICRRSTFRRRTCEFTGLSPVRQVRRRAGLLRSGLLRQGVLPELDLMPIARAGLLRSGLLRQDQKRGHPALPIGTGGVAKKRLTEQEWVAPEQAGAVGKTQMGHQAYPKSERFWSSKLPDPQN